MAGWESSSGETDRDDTSLQDELEEIFEKRLRRRRTISLVAFGVLGLVGVVVLAPYIPRPNFRPLNTLTIGEETSIAFTSMLAVDDEAFSYMTELQAAGDNVGLNLLEREGRTFILDGGTRVVVVDPRFTTVMVRALEGRNEGKTGWVQLGRLIP